MLTKPLEAYISKVINEFDQIPDDRKTVLESIANFINTKVQRKEVVSLTLICTHNSRRSHMSQVWAQVAAHYYKVPHVNAYSGGTASTALFPVAAEALQEAGLEVNKLSEGENPVYSLKYDNTEHPIIGFSKKYNDQFNAQSGYAAIMTCSHADENCPFIPEAELRISLPYEDPKAFDGTPQQKEKYVERCRDIARELFYAFSKVG